MGGSRPELAHPQHGRGQTISSATTAAWEQRSGAPLIELWGMTELAGPGSTHWHDRRAWARELLRTATDRQTAVFLFQGRMVDGPVFAQARRILRLAGGVEAGGGVGSTS